MKGNVHSSGCELKTRPWSHSGGSASLSEEIDCSVPSHRFRGVSWGLWLELRCLFFLHPPFHDPLSQSARETKAASHVLQTVWSYKELRNALTKDGWNKSHFQVLECKLNESILHICSGCRVFLLCSSIKFSIQTQHLEGLHNKAELSHNSEMNWETNLITFLNLNWIAVFSYEM